MVYTQSSTRPIQRISAGRLCGLSSLAIGILIFIVLWQIQGVSLLLIMSFIIGLAGLAAGICAIRMRKNMKSGTKKVAFLGVILNGALLCHLAVLMSIHGVFFNFAKINRERCLKNLETIKMQMAYYASCNGGFYPAASGSKGLTDLRRWIKAEKNKSLYAKSKVYYCPASTLIELGPGWNVRSLVYLSGSFAVSDLDSENRGIPLVFDRPGNHNGFINVLFADGEVKTFKTDVRTNAEFIDFLNQEYMYSEERLKFFQEKVKDSDAVTPPSGKLPEGTTQGVENIKQLKQTGEKTVKTVSNKKTD